MTVDAALFARGLSYAGFKDAMTRNRDVIEASERAVVLDPDDVEFFRHLPRPLNVLVLAEDWCTDVTSNLPVLARLAEASGTLEVRIFDKAKHPALMARYLNQGKFESIPVFAFFDREFREVGVFTERPASVTAKRAERRLAIYAADPSFGSPDAPPADLADDIRSRLLAAIQAMRADLKAWADGEVVRELRSIAARALAA